jgi:hypothetical protein
LLGERILKSLRLAISLDNKIRTNERRLPRHRIKIPLIPPLVGWLGRWVEGSGTTGRKADVSETVEKYKSAPCINCTTKSLETHTREPALSASSQQSSATMSGSTTDDSGRTTPLSPARSVGVMIRPGQQGALYFDKANITDFLRRWNIECEDYNLNDKQKCARIIDYCSAETKDIIEVLEGYADSNWEKLQNELKELFWQYDKQRDSTISLNQLIKDAPTLDLNIFIVRYSAISEKLVKAGALSSLDRVVRLINSLPAKLREQSIEFCTKEDWKLSSNDTGANKPDFEKLKRFIVTKAQSAQKRAVLDQERDIAETPDTYSSVPDTVSSIAPAIPNSSPKVHICSQGPYGGHHSANVASHVDS